MPPLVQRTSCTALVITCSDFRFKSGEQAFIHAAGLTDDYDLIARPGAIRALVQPRSAAARDTLTEEVRLLWNVHKFPRVLMVNHTSCRAYDDIATPQNERELHEQHLRAAKVVIESWFAADVRAEAYLAVFENPHELEVQRITV